MIDPLLPLPGATALFDRLADLLGFDPRAGLDAAHLAQNRVTSLLTVGASLLLLDLLRNSGGAQPLAVAGYSVGQWVALHAAGALDSEQLLHFVAARAAIMDEVAAAGGPAGMLAVIGVGRGALEGLCATATRDGHLLDIANDNAPGQFTLSGSAAGLAFAAAALPALKPRLVRRLTVPGAWHSRLMQPAAARLRPEVEALALKPLALPVIDNRTGGWLPTVPPPAALAEHVAAPVLWGAGVRLMRDTGARTFVEVGYGSMLSRFGFFIDRDCAHLPLLREPCRAGPG